MLHPGDVIDSYEVLRPLGEGGFASVWLVRHRVLHSLHALKLLDPELAASDRMRERFLVEGRILAQLRHPNLVPVTDVLAEPPDRVGLVMDYLEGEALDQRVARGPLAPQEAVQLLLGLLDGMQHAHERGVIHRDLKPANIIVLPGASGPRPVILDFGIAKVMGEATVTTGRDRRTRMGVQMGTPEYMSPEQVRSAGEVDERADIWALGVILYELLVGEPPIHGGDAAAVMARVASGVVPRHPAIPDALWAVLQAVFVPDPAARLPSCAAFAAALQGAPAPRRVTVVEAPAGPPAPPPAPAVHDPAPVAAPASSRAPLWVAVAAATGLLVGVCGLGGALLARPFFTTPAPVAAPAPSEAPAPSAPVEPVVVDAPAQPAPAQPAPAQPTPSQPTPSQPAPATPAPAPAPPPPAPTPKPSPPTSPPKPTPSPKPAPSPKPTPPTTPSPSPGVDDEATLRMAFRRLRPLIGSCYSAHGRGQPSVWTVTVDLGVDGKATSGTASGNPANPALQGCLTKVLRSADFGTLSKAQKHTWTLKLPTSP